MWSDWLDSIGNCDRLCLFIYWKNLLSAQFIVACAIQIITSCPFVPSATAITATNIHWTHITDQILSIFVRCVCVCKYVCDVYAMCVCVHFYPSQQLFESNSCYMRETKETFIHFKCIIVANRSVCAILMSSVEVHWLIRLFWAFFHIRFSLSISYVFSLIAQVQWHVHIFFFSSLHLCGAGTAQDSLGYTYNQATYILYGNDMPNSNMPDLQ